MERATLAFWGLLGHLGAAIEHIRGFGRWLTSEHHR